MSQLVTWVTQLLVPHSPWLFFLQLHCVVAVNLLLDPRIKAAIAFLVQTHSLHNFTFDKASFERPRMTH